MLALLSGFAPTVQFRRKAQTLCRRLTILNVLIAESVQMNV